MTSDRADVQHGLHAVATRVASAIERGRLQGWLPGDAKPLLANLESGATAADGTTGGPLELLRERLELSSTEILALLTLVAFDTDPRLGRLLAHLADGPTVTIGVLLSVVYPDATVAGVAELAEHGQLRRLGLLLIDPADTNAPISLRRVRVADRVVELALGTVALDHALADLARIDDTSPAALTELVVPPGAAERLKAAMLEPVTAMIVVQGRCGAGRRSLLAAAVAAHGKRALTIDARAISPKRDEARTQLRTVARECRLLELVPLLRDLDALSASGDAQDRLDLVESELSGCVLATTTRRIPRRWNQPPTWIELPDLGGAQRAELWQRAIPVASAGDAEVLANMYPLAPALMAAVGKSAMRACDGAEMRPHHIEGAIRTVLDDRLAGLATRITTTQTWDDLVLPEDQTTAIIELLARIRERQRVYEEWGFAEKVGKGLGIAALFSGPPGTGKTMAAGLICRALHVEMFQVDLSKITSKWIGETEKNLAALFDAAESGHAVLLFDEADSLFGKRSAVRSSNDRHANQEVNYLLQRMENFAGICLLTTNHETAIDAAFRRRLTVQVRFPMPDATERKRLWGTLLPSKAPVAEHLGLEELAAKYMMSGGHIKNAVVRAAFLAADQNGEITAAHLLKAAQLEYEAMGKLG